MLSACTGYNFWFTGSSAAALVFFLGSGDSSDISFYGEVVNPVSVQPKQKKTNKQTPWSESASELYRPSDCRFLAK
jgi:hypothetical protein